MTEWLTLLPSLSSLRKDSAQRWSLPSWQSAPDSREQSGETWKIELTASSWCVEIKFQSLYLRPLTLICTWILHKMRWPCLPEVESDLQLTAHPGERPRPSITTLLCLWHRAGNFTNCHQHSPKYARKSAVSTLKVCCVFRICEYTSGRKGSATCLLSGSCMVKVVLNIKRALSC